MNFFARLVNVFRCIRSLGFRSGLRYAHGTASEGDDFITLGQTDDFEYCLIQKNADGFILSLYSTEEGFLEVLDACSSSDADKLLSWQRDYNASYDV